MLQRIPEPEVMDSAEEAAAYDEMDHGGVNAAFADDLVAMLGDLARGESLRVLDVGTGTALIPIAICHRASAIELLAVDMSDAMLDLARRRVERAGLAKRITIEHADAKALPYADDSFDALVSNSLVHHIAEPRPMLAELARAVRPGGALLVRDLSRPADEATLARLVERYAASSTPEQRELFAASLRAALTLEEVRALVTELGFDPATVRHTSDRHWTWACASAPDGGWPAAIVRSP